MTEKIPDGGDKDGEIRAAALNIVLATFGKSSKEFERVNIDVARLTAGIDPDSIDRRSLEYIFGAAEALSSTISAAIERLPDADTVDFILRKKNARLIAVIAAEPGIVESSLPVEELEGDGTINAITNTRVFSLSRIGMIEPALPPEGITEKAWKLSPGGRSFYLRLLPELAESAGIEETLDGLRGILASDRIKDGSS